MPPSREQGITALSMLCIHLWCSPGKAVFQTTALFSEFLLYGCLLARKLSQPVHLWGSRFSASFGRQGGKQCLIALVGAVFSGGIATLLLLVQPGAVSTSCWVTHLPPAPACSGVTDTLFLVLWSWNRPSFLSDPDLFLSNLSPSSYTSP